MSFAEENSALYGDCSGPEFIVKSGSKMLRHPNRVIKEIAEFSNGKIEKIENIGGVNGLWAARIRWPPLDGKKYTSKGEGILDVYVQSRFICPVGDVRLDEYQKRELCKDGHIIIYLQ